MVTLTQSLILISNCINDFGIEVDPIELMHWILIAQDAASAAM